MTDNLSQNKHPTREQWLNAAAHLLDRKYFRKEHPLPKVLVSVGLGQKKTHIGLCFDKIASEDKETAHIFIAPGETDPVHIMDILLHELIHAHCGHEAGHKAPFRALAKKFGLEGKMTSTTPGAALKTELEFLAGQLGSYPHVRLNAWKIKPKRPGGGGWVRYKSITEEEYKVMVSPTQLENHGAPRDPWGEEMIPNDSEGGEDEGEEE